jgi:hypothetical protein
MQAHAPPDASRARPLNNGQDMHSLQRPLADTTTTWTCHAYLQPCKHKQHDTTPQQLHCAEWENWADGACNSLAQIAIEPLASVLHAVALRQLAAAPQRAFVVVHASDAPARRQPLHRRERG